MSDDNKPTPPPPPPPPEKPDPTMTVHIRDTSGETRHFSTYRRDITRTNKGK